MSPACAPRQERVAGQWISIVRPSVPSILIDDFSDATLWAALQPGPAPSPEIVLTADPSVHADLTDSVSMRLEVSEMASGHFLRRTLPPLDLTSFSELRMWIRSSLQADGSSERPFRLRMELGSAAMPVGAPGNLWHRYLPAYRRNHWQFVQMSLDDLDPLVAGGVDTVQFSVAGDPIPWTAWLDDLVVCEPHLIADVHGALEQLLDGQLVIGGPVPAQVLVPGAVEPAEPWIRLVHYDAAYSDIRTSGSRPRSDFTDAGYRVRPESVAYDLFYRIEPMTSDPDDHADMLRFVLEVLGHRRTLLVNGVRLQLDRVGSQRGDAWGDVPVLRYRVAARQERGTAQPVSPTTEVVLKTELAP